MLLVEPHRTRIVLANVVGGTILGLGFIALLELLNRSIRRPVELNRRLGINAFATIPYIRTRRQIRLRRTVRSTLH